MSNQLELISIPKNLYSTYAQDITIEVYNTRAQTMRRGTIADNVLLLGSSHSDKLIKFAEALACETMNIEEELWQRSELTGCLGFSDKILKKLRGIRNYDRRDHVRLMRFDFCWTEIGWRLAGLHNDTPSGLSVSPVLNNYGQQYLGYGEVIEDVRCHMYDAFSKKSPISEACVGFVYVPSSMDNNVSLLGCYLESKGVTPLYLTPNQIKWVHGKAYGVVDKSQRRLSGIIRCFPVEHFQKYKWNDNWMNYFRTHVRSCNHPIALYSQSRRIPLIWNFLMSDVSTWRVLMPEVRTCVGAEGVDDGNWVYKPVLSGVEGICSGDVKRAHLDIGKCPERWVRQMTIRGTPLVDSFGRKQRFCLSAFVVNGKFAGYYGRISTKTQIGRSVQDLPIVVSTSGQTIHRAKGKA